jgi:hypothetical protein
MTKAQLNKIVKKWQDRLGLTAWTITASFVDMKEFQYGSDEIAYGDIQYETLQRVAHIRIVHPKHAKQFIEPLPKPDTENIVVHELLHLVTDPVVKRVGGDAHEQLINLLTSLITNKD